MDSYLCVYVHILRFMSNLYTAVHACTACAFCFLSSAEFCTLKEYSAIARLQNMGTLFFGKLPLCMQSPICFLKRQWLYITIRTLLTQQQY